MLVLLLQAQPTPLFSLEKVRMELRAGDRAVVRQSFPVFELSMNELINSETANSAYLLTVWCCDVWNAD
jgi:hypothetical protein